MKYLYIVLIILMLNIVIYSQEENSSNGTWIVKSFEKKEWLADGTISEKEAQLFLGSIIEYSPGIFTINNQAIKLYNSIYINLITDPDLSADSILIATDILKTENIDIGKIQDIFLGEYSNIDNKKLFGNKIFYINNDLIVVSYGSYLFKLRREK